MSGNPVVGESEIVDGLPKQFVSSLKILFDILDETRSGLVRFRDIESRWSDDGTRGLPAGVIEGLRKVTPANGLLSFERFVAGLKLVLVKKGEDSKRRRSEREDRRGILMKERDDIMGNLMKENREDRGNLMKEDMRGNLVKEDRENRREVVTLGQTPLQEFNFGERGNSRDGNSNKIGNEARFTDKHSNREYENNMNQTRILQQQYQTQSSNSMKATSYAEHRSHRDPLYDVQNSRESRSHGDLHYDVQTSRDGRRSPPVQSLKGGSTSRGISQTSYAIKPEVSAYPTAIGSHHPPPNSAGIFRQVIGNNQMPHDRAPAIPPRCDRPPRTSYSHNMKKSLSGPNLVSQTHSPPAVPPRSQHQNARILSDLKNWQKEWTTVKPNGDRNYVHENMSRNSNQDNGIYANIEQFQRRSEPELKHPPSGPHKATVQRHGSGRRHTLANGIDQNMLKRMKQLEEETTMLRSGLSMVDSARGWYVKQLAQVSDKQAMLGKVTFNDNSVEAHQERMNFQRARIAEINQHLQTLLESSEKGFPIHMNLAVPAFTNNPVDNITLQRLQEQNRQLREDVGQKQEHITQLEKEKASLVRDLFEVRSKNNSGHDDTTFM